MPVTVTKDYRSAVWSKLIFSAVMNPLPVLMGQDYEIIRRDRRTYKLVLAAMEEGKSVARALGVKLAFDPVKIVRELRVGRSVGHSHKGSMYHDFVRGRALETEYITGAVVRSARAVGLKTPVLDVIYSSIKALEKTREKKR